MAPLTSLTSGKSSVIYKLDENMSREQRRRLLDLGIYPGASIKHCFDSVTGEPKAFEVLGSVIALRKEQTDKIYTSEN